MAAWIVSDDDMLASLALTVVCLQLKAAPLQEPGTVVALPDFSSAQSFADPLRLELSPTLDGTISEEEWDPLVSTRTMQGYMQWAPRTIYAAARLTVASDLILSFDFGGKGWLLGKNHVEVRASFANGSPTVRARILDATNPVGPAWVDFSALASASEIAATADGSNWTVELKLVDPGIGMFPSQSGKSIAMRMDEIAASAPDPQPYLPRTLAKATLVNFRATGLPTGIRFRPEESGRIVVPGDATGIRLTFNGKPSVAIQKIEMKSEGFAKDTTTVVTTPFPDFDRKDRTFVDYDLRVAKSSSVGYRIARGTLTLADGTNAITQTSYEIAPLLEFELPIEYANSKPAVQTVRLGVYIRSNSGRRIDGTFSVLPPPGWKIVDGNDKRFILYGSFGRKRQVFTTEIPAGVHGSFPFKIRGEVGTALFEQTVWKVVK